MENPVLREHCVRHLDLLIRLAERECERTHDWPDVHFLAQMYRRLFGEARETFVGRCGTRLVTAFREYAEAGNLELITCAGTHGYLPLLSSEPSAVRAQVLTAVQEHERLFGHEQRGMWVPECAFYPGLMAFAFASSLAAKGFCRERIASRTWPSLNLGPGRGARRWARSCRRGRRGTGSCCRASRRAGGVSEGDGHCGASLKGIACRKGCRVHRRIRPGPGPLSEASCPAGVLREPAGSGAAHDPGKRGAGIRAGPARRPLIAGTAGGRGRPVGGRRLPMIG
jgi:hypothetical protein